MCAVNTRKTWIYPIYGWHNIRNPNFVAQDKIEFRNDARKFEAGTQNLIGLTGLIASMEMIFELGVENIAAELLRKRAWFLPELQKRGFTVLSANEKTENAGSIFSFFHPSKEMPAHYLGSTTDGAAGIITSSAHRSGQERRLLTFVFHRITYNTDTELQRVLEVLSA